MAALPVYLLTLLALFKVLVILPSPCFELNFDAVFVDCCEFSITVDTTGEGGDLPGQIKLGDYFY